MSILTSPPVSQKTGSCNRNISPFAFLQKLFLDFKAHDSCLGCSTVAFAGGFMLESMLLFFVFFFQFSF